ncbi:2,3-dihydro-2,3-dihydroxybenzoate dehydrogenase [Thioclava sp. SK-1]|uniref:SDR family oxidoreductase n=1 Tax=Thioclava sp. SK-1 TaxID=1889770 RepID=UPI000824AE63|nr:SDR family oxidoreductase [Thioclava sp. SK-1]OCX61274.1 2,3-dihydro-2,3-dihydroxybenzoate dehydrogenase [Thioclava sp. SK-1]
MKLTGFDGTTAFVAGAAGGIGRALVAALVDSGVQVYATDRAEAVADLAPMPGVIWAALDVTDATAVDRAVAQCEAQLGPIRHGIFAAGILGGGPLLATSIEDWRRVVDVNLNGGFCVTSALARVMVPRKGGSIVAVGSNSADIPRLNMGSYPASKAALHMYIRCLGLEIAPHGVRCNIVAPGSTLTPMQTGMWADERGAQAVIGGNLALHKTGIPLGKLATPEDIAASTMFLLSDQAGHVTMADLYVDGGATLKA